MCIACWESDGRPYRYTSQAKLAAKLFRGLRSRGGGHVHDHMVGGWYLADDDLEALRPHATDALERNVIDAFVRMSDAEKYAAALHGTYKPFNPKRTRLDSRRFGAARRSMFDPNGKLIVTLD